jgi:hypothetical protein
MPFVKVGLALKLNASNGSWKKRSLVLEATARTLQIYADTDTCFANVLALLDLAGAKVETTTSTKAHTFRVSTGTLVWEFATASSTEKDEWISTIIAVCLEEYIARKIAEEMGVPVDPGRMKLALPAFQGAGDQITAAHAFWDSGFQNFVTNTRSKGFFAGMAVLLVDKVIWPSYTGKLGFEMMHWK